VRPEWSITLTPAKAKGPKVTRIPAGLDSSTKPEKSEASWFVYLLLCVDGTLYTGITNDVPRRCEQHNAGTASRYTRSRRPVVLVYQEPQISRSAALKRELAIKGLSRRAKESLVRLAG